MTNTWAQCWKYNPRGAYIICVMVLRSEMKTHMKGNKKEQQRHTHNPNKQRSRRGTCVLHCWLANAESVIALYHALYRTDRGESTGSAKPYRTLFLLLKQASSSFYKTWLTTATYSEGRATWPKISISSSLVATALYQGVPKRKLHTKYGSTSFYLLRGSVIEQTPKTEWNIKPK